MKFSVEEWVEDHLSHVKVSGGGDEREAVCPSCGKYGSFYVNATTGAYICFSCEFRGRNAVGLIAEVEGISRSEARRRLMRGIVEFKRVEPLTILERIAALRGGTTDVEEKMAVEMPLPVEFVPVYDKKRDKWRFPAYLANRGMKRETARFFNIGFCRSGDYGGRVVFPIVCPNGYSFTARDVTGRGIPRYKNPTGAGLGRLLFGWDTLVKDHDFLVVEGPMDAAMAYQAGFPAIALCGKNLGEEQEAMIGGMSLGSAIVMLDPEEGLAPVNVATKLMKVVEDVYMADLPDGKDPGSATPAEIVEAYDNAARYRGKRALRALGALKDARKKLDKRYPSKT